MTEYFICPLWSLGSPHENSPISSRFGRRVQPTVLEHQVCETQRRDSPKEPEAHNTTSAFLLESCCCTRRCSNNRKYYQFPKYSTLLICIYPNSPVPGSTCSHTHQRTKAILNNNLRDVFAGFTTFFSNVSKDRTYSTSSQDLMYGLSIRAAVNESCPPAMGPPMFNHLVLQTLRTSLTICFNGVFSGSL